MNTGKIYNEDCLKTMNRMESNFIDLVVTSPPYDKLRAYNGYKFNFEAVASELYRVLKPNGVLVWIVADSTVNGSESGTSFKQALKFKELGFSLFDTMIYQKKGCPSPQKPEIRYLHVFEYMFVFCKGVRPKAINLITKPNLKQGKRRVSSSKVQRNGKRLISNFTSREASPLPNVWLIDSTNGARESSAIHPAAFPEVIPHRHIYTWSNEGDIIYDPFMGSGTTAKMAHILNRRWIGSEVSLEYTMKARKRLFPYLNQLRIF